LRVHSFLVLFLIASFLVAEPAVAIEGDGYEGQQLLARDDALACYSRADSLYNQGKYGEAVEYYNRAIDSWAQELRAIQTKMDEIKLNLLETSQKQEELNATYVQNESRYSSQQMMDNALTDTTEALVTEFIPFNLLPHPADEIMEGAQTVDSIPGVVGTLKNTRDALIWQSQGRNQNREAWTKLENLRQEAQGEYNAADLESHRISGLIESAQLGINRASEAMNGRT